jgi:hypothetical protein
MTKNLTSVTIAGIQPGIRTDRFLHTSQKRSSWTSLLGCPLVDSKTCKKPARSSSACILLGLLFGTLCHNNAKCPNTIWGPSKIVQLSLVTTVTELSQLPELDVYISILCSKTIFRKPLHELLSIHVVHVHLLRFLCTYGTTYRGRHVCVSPHVSHTPLVGF